MRYGLGHGLVLPHGVRVDSSGWGVKGGDDREAEWLRVLAPLPRSCPGVGVHLAIRPDVYLASTLLRTAVPICKTLKMPNPPECAIYKSHWA